MGMGEDWRGWCFGISKGVHQEMVKLREATIAARFYEPVRPGKSLDGMTY
jgi:hypothetical protein